MLRSFTNIHRPVGAPAPKVNFDGKWVNELGSTMDLKVDHDGCLEGTYVTAVGAPGSKESFEITGFAAGDQIAFVVNFGKYGTLTSWVGQHTDESEGAVIKSVWILSRNIPDQNEPKELWGAVLTGSNSFTR